MQQGPKQDLVKAAAKQCATPRTASLPETAARPSRRFGLYRSFFQGEDGAVTVDWVVLTAAIVGLGFVVLLPIGYSTESSVVELKGTIMAVDTGYTATVP